jgi:hypothetical protein
MFTSKISLSPVYNHNLEVISLNITIGIYQIMGVILIREAVSFRMTIHDKLEDREKITYFSLSTKNDKDVEVGTPLIFNIGNSKFPLCISLNVENQNLEFFRKMKKFGADLAPYDRTYCHFSMN